VNQPTRRNIERTAAVASRAAGKGNHQSKDDRESAHDITKKDKKTGKRIFESDIRD
jgi:hypothetical protein